jgi:hypothetical protein
MSEYYRALVLQGKWLATNQNERHVPQLNGERDEVNKHMKLSNKYEEHAEVVEKLREEVPKESDVGLQVGRKVHEAIGLPQKLPGLNHCKGNIEEATEENRNQ